MGPFVPDLITDQLNLVVALILGIGFGFVLEQAGFSSSRRLAGVFYGYDFTVLRVFFTAAVTAMSGVLLLGYLGLLDTEMIFVNPTWLIPAIVGGVIMGLGFILGGYCPGTSISAAAIGKIDAMFFIGGGLLGVFLFGELFPLYNVFFDSTFLGPIKVYESLGISQGMFAFLLIAMAVTAFTVTSMIERRVDKTSAPSFLFKTRNHVAAGASVFVLGVLFIFLPDRKTHLINMVSNPGYIYSHPVVAMEVDELAFRIVDHEPNIRMIDIRPAQEFSKLSLPGSLNAAPRDLFGKDWTANLAQRHVKKVVIGQTEDQERITYLLLQELGYENLAILRGGFQEFDRTILNPPAFVPTGSRWDPDVKMFRENAQIQIQNMIAENKNKGSKEPKKARKIQGGC